MTDRRDSNYTVTCVEFLRVRDLRLSQLTQSDWGLWDDSMRVFKCLCDNAQQSICHLAREIGLSKNSVKDYALAIGRRLKQAQK